MLVSGDGSGVTVGENGLMVEPSAYNQLAVGESEVITYAFDVIDGNGGSVSQTATITITGVNDVPMVSGIVESATEEDVSFTVDLLSTSSDVDLSDVLVLDSVILLSGDDAGVMVRGTSLVVDPSAYSSLVDGQSEVITYEFVVNDQNGGVVMQTATITIVGISSACDFDDDGDCDGVDIDALQANVISGPADPATFDLTGDGVVSVADRDEWLILAGAENLASGNAYLSADANLDGFVDVSDFNAWNDNKFSVMSAWTSGDFNLDGVVDVSDFNIWNSAKFTASDSMFRTVDGEEADEERFEENVIERIFAEFDG